MLINLEAFSKRELRNFDTLCQYFSVNGVTEIDGVRSVLSNYLKEFDIAKRKNKIRSEREIKVRIRNDSKSVESCPDCEYPMSISVVDGLTILTCKACRYSRVKEVM